MLVSVVVGPDERRGAPRVSRDRVRSRSACQTGQQADLVERCQAGAFKKELARISRHPTVETVRAIIKRQPAVLPGELDLPTTSRLPPAPTAPTDSRDHAAPPEAGYCSAAFSSFNLATTSAIGHAGRNHGERLWLRFGRRRRFGLPALGELFQHSPGFSHPRGPTRPGRTRVPGTPDPAVVRHRGRALRAHLFGRKRSFRDQAITLSGCLVQLGFGVRPARPYRWTS